MNAEKTDTEFEHVNTDTGLSHLNFCFPRLDSKVSNPVNFENVEVFVFVFYGRRQNVAILDRYLQRNSRENGGIISRVLFVANSVKTKPEDVAWIYKLVQANPDYYKLVISSGPWTENYRHITNPDAVYIKMDDDVVFIEDGTFESMVYELIHTPWLIMSANVVNHCIFTGIHHVIGALRPYTLDLSPSGIVVKDEIKDWRVRNISAAKAGSWLQMNDEDIGSAKRRLGLANETDGFLFGSPLSLAKLDPWDSCTQKSWHCAAAAHYSLFDAIEHNDTERYHFKTWDLHAEKYDRWSINFIAFWGRSLLNVTVPGDDELFLSHHYPKAVGRHAGSVGRALVAHLAYYTQSGAYKHADVLEKYEALSLEISGTRLHGLGCPI
ncbi:hypothetical protein HK100_010928 [Physocladia obscura]|uniref:Uncharacterized protein n=1 Tax=Physocladia obscura TaxID=109957 RepID=A0AAD5T1W9_9FUNG|nr:hypothetical protein HK100_010928 [Physocladia obscura]